MAFSMFASVAFGDTAVTPQQKFDALAAKGYDAKNWAVPYIEAVTAAGIMQGQDNVKKIFNYNGKVTIQEMATVLTRALKLEIPANPNNNAADWAKGYVQAAIDKGLISKDANFKANASRSQLVEAAYAIDQATNITFTYKVVDPSNVEFTLSTGEVVKVKLDKPLEANKETEVKFKDAAGNEYTAKLFLNDNKVTLNFSNPLNYTENTLHIAGVTDYSNNSANVDTTVTPTLDTVRPTVIGSDFYKDGNNYYVELQFSKSLDLESARNKDNYVLKNADGSVADVTGVDSNGHPVIVPSYNESTKKVTVNLGTGLDSSKTYTLTASGVKDTAYVSNVLLPYTVTLAANTVQNGEISRAWADVNNVKASYVADADGNYFSQVQDGKSGLPTSYTLSDDKKTLYLEFASGTLAPTVADTVKLKTVASPSTQDSYGNKIDAFVDGKVVKDGIAPSSTGASFKKAGADYTVQINTDEIVKETGNLH
ncbi:hypothetical protein BGX30_005785 [Mortierella sp. GBA39]|nr:hypothetical protein BGX30_005785 [Mortierella sp. GBA39]